MLAVEQLSFSFPGRTILDQVSFQLRQGAITCLLGGNGSGNPCDQRNPWSISAALLFAAAAFMILVPEALRFVGLPSAIAANVRQMLYGAALVAVIWLSHSRNKQERPIPASPA